VKRKHANKKPGSQRAGLFLIGGATGNRTPDLYNAIVALSHLSYDPALFFSAAASAALIILFVDVLDHLGHIVFVFAEFGGVLENLFFLFLAFGLLGFLLLALDLGFGIGR
jgi:hypothetical protein